MMLARICTVAIAFLVGCEANPRKPVSGTVTFDGKPLADGTIRFESLTVQAYCTEGALVENGSFSIPSKSGLLPGKYRVFISGTASDRGNPMTATDSGSAGNSPDSIPPRYNAKSELTAEVTVDGSNRFSFDLTR